ncbi:response regulator [Pedobacter sp. P351]|uniref:response regulator n=1 Tax=Pedobacter superstes TaxID=3133441 RepID=UPI0030A9E8CF
MNCILLIEDDDAIRNVIQEALNNYKVIAIDNTDNISGLIREHKPDLVLMDYILPKINGGELCHQIKSNPETAGIPVIIISGYPQILYSLGSYGCDAILEKPFDLSTLIEIVAKFDPINN